MGWGSLSAQQRILVTLELLGGREYAARMKGAAAQTTNLGRANQYAADRMALATRRTWLQNQALFTMRRYAFYGTLAVTTLAAGVAKLGYSYLAAMQTARVALKPVIKDQGTFNKYFKELFQISKYSPFVITDVTTAFRQMYVGLSQVGIGGQQTIVILRDLTNLLAYTGKVTPQALSRVSFGIQHLAYAGRVTGYMLNQLYREGIPVAPIMEKYFGLDTEAIHKIANYNISGQQFLAALHRYAVDNKGVRGAAYRLSTQSLPGLIQVGRDTLSQLSAGFLKGTYGGSQGWLAHALRPTGLLGKASAMSVNQSGTAALMFLSKGISGNTGLAQGLLLLLNIGKQVARVFAHDVAPAFFIALHTLIIFYPFLKLAQIALKFLADHANIAKWVFAALAAEFIITHFALLGVWSATRLTNIATFGLITLMKRLIGALFILNAQGFTVMLRTTFPRMIGALETMYIWWLLNGTAIKAFWLSIILPAGIVAAFVGTFVILYLKVKAFRDEINGLGNDLSNLYNTILHINAIVHGRGYDHKSWWQRVGSFVGSEIRIGGKLLPFSMAGKGHATGGFVGGMTMWNERGMEMAVLPNGSRIIPNSQLPPSAVGSGRDALTIIAQLVVDRQILASAVARANQDKRARK